MDLQFLASTPLFAGVDPADIEKMLSCLSIHQRRYEKDSYILTAEQTPADIGVVLRGSVNLIKEDYWGNRAIITKITAGGVFGEAWFLHGSQNHAWSALWRRSGAISCSSITGRSRQPAPTPVRSIQP